MKLYLLDILEIKRLRKSIEKMVKKYSSDKKVNNVQRLTNNCSNFGENITKSNVKHNTHLIDDDYY